MSDAFAVDDLRAEVDAYLSKHPVVGVPKATPVIAWLTWYHPRPFEHLGGGIFDGRCLPTPHAALAALTDAAIIAGAQAMRQLCQLITGDGRLRVTHSFTSVRWSQDTKGESRFSLAPAPSYETSPITVPSRR